MDTPSTVKVLVLRKGAALCQGQLHTDPAWIAVVAVVASPLEVSRVLSRLDILKRIEGVGEWISMNRKLGEILRNLTSENLLEKAREFA